jgi:hypothetical protein
MNLRSNDVDYAIQLLYRLKNVCHENESEGKNRRANHLIGHAMECLDNLQEWTNEQPRQRQPRMHPNGISVNPVPPNTQAGE